MLANVYSEGRTIVDLNTTEKQMIWDWYNNQSNVVSVWSRNILVYLDELNYDLEVILPDNDNKSTLINQAFEVNTPEDEYASLSVFPNPAKEYVICNYKINIPLSNAHIVITEAASGKSKKVIKLYTNQDQKTIDLGALNTGNYILSIKMDTEVVNSVKFNIVK